MIYLKPLAAIGGITAITIMAIASGVDGLIASAGIGGLAAIGGFVLGRRRKI